MKLHLLGAFEALGDDGRVVAFRSDRERALLAYLAVEANGAHRRDALATLFWPEADEKQARNNLRVTLHRLRQALERAGEADDFLQASRSDVRIVSEDGLFVDERTLAAVVDRTDRHEHTGRRDCGVCVAELEEIVDLYRGEFLEGFSLVDSQRFSEWALLRQQRLHRQILRALHDVAAFHISQGNLSRARRFANRQLELEPWREEAHRQLMTILARSGERTAALNQFEICQTLLASELAVAPSEETAALYEEIQRGEVSAGAVAGAPPPALPPPAREKRERARPEPAVRPLKGVARTAVPWSLAPLAFILLALAGWAAWTGLTPRGEIYDDFDRRPATGIPDPARWTFPHQRPGDSCGFVQTAGVLKIVASANPLTGGCALRVRQPEEVAGMSLGAMVARLRLATEPERGSLVVGLRVSSTFAYGDWNVDCGIAAGTDASAFVMAVSDSRRNATLYRTETRIQPDKWYDARLAVAPETMAVTCLLGDIEVGSYSPLTPEELQAAPFVREILVQDASGQPGEIWIDDFRFGP